MTASGATANRRPIAPSSRSIGVPSCVPLVKLHTAQQDLLIEPRRCEHVGDKTGQQIPQRSHLLGESKDLGPAARVSFLVEPGKHTLVQPRHQRVEFIGERLGSFPRRRDFIRERDAPHLRASFLHDVIELYSVNPATRSTLVTIR